MYSKTKKIATLFMAAVATLCAFASCGKEKTEKPSADKIACYVAPEPAASVKVNKTSLEFVGDLQALYGSDKGYPQAVLVAKTTLCENYGGWVDAFATSMTEAAAWANASTTRPEEIVNAIGAHLTEGLTPSLNTANLSATAIAHSGVRFEKAIEYKTQINAFLEKLVAVNSSAAKTVSDGFYYQSSLSSETTAPASVSVYMPDGAPAMSMAKLMKEDTVEDNIAYQVVDASTINTYVTGENPKADLCVLPLNLASKLLGTGEAYKLVGAVTHGNLYMLSSDASTQYTRENLADLVGKTVGVVQLQNVPGLTFKVILNECGIAWQELTDGVSPAADKVNLKAVTPDQVLPNV